MRKHKRNNLKGLSSLYESKRTRRLVEKRDEDEELKAQAFEKICNDPDWFETYFNDIRVTIQVEGRLEFGEDLWDFAEETEWNTEESFAEMLVTSVAKDPKNNRPLQKGDLHCAFVYDNDDPYSMIQTFDREDSWYDAIRKICVEKELWTYDLRDSDNEILEVLDRED